MQNLKSQFLRAIVALAMFAGSGQLFASPLSYHVAIDTSTLGGQSGYLDFLFLGLGSAASATASISHLSGNFDTAKSFTYGAPQGTLATMLKLANGDEFGQGATFGGVFAFDVGFTGLNDLTAQGIDLSIALLGNDQFSYAAGTDRNLVTFSLQPGAPDVLDVDSRFASVGAVPEPASMALVAAGLALLYGNKRRRAR
jgi:hypothetical protein